MLTRSILVVLGLALAGCTSDQGPAEASAGVPPMAQATAKATEWHSGAGLAGIVAIEAPATSARPPQFGDDFYAPVFRHPDATVGDGRAPVWLLVYATASSSDRQFEVLVTPEGKPLAHREVSRAAPAMLPAGLAIITEGLAQQLDALHPGWHAGNVEQAALVWSLQDDQGSPVWAVQGAINAEGRAGVYVFDARTGTPMLQTLDGTVVVPQESSSGTETVNPLHPEGKNQKFLLNHAHDQVVVHVTASNTSVGSIEAVLRDPGGNETAFANGAAKATPAAKGEWTIHVRGTGVLPISFAYDWCAQGTGPGGAC